MSFDPRSYYQDTRAAERYDEKRFKSLSGKLFQWAERRCIARIAKHLEPGSVVLDAPCGTGRLMDLFLSKTLSVIGGDVSGEMISVARRRTDRWNGRVSFCRMDLVHIPFEDRAVTAAFSNRFLPHIVPTERIAMLKEMRRISQRWVIISVSLSNPWHRLRRKIKDWLGLPKAVRHPVTAAELERELREAGLTVIERHYTFPVLSEQLLLVCEKG